MVSTGICSECPVFTFVLCFLCVSYFYFFPFFLLVIFFFLVPTFHGKCVHNIRPTSGIGNLNIYPGEAFLEFLLPFSFFSFFFWLHYFILHIHIPRALPC
jgi:hypothetical protein